MIKRCPTPSRLWRVTASRGCGLTPAGGNGTTLHRWYINEPMKHSAARIAQTFQPRDISDLDDATLWLHCLTRGVWLGISDEPEFQAIVDSNVKGFIYPPDLICWVNPSGIWIPLSEGTARQIHCSLIARYKQAYFTQHCWAELLRRNPRNEAQKYAFVLLTDCDEFCNERNEADQWLRDKSRRIAPDVGEDAMHDCAKRRAYASHKAE